MSLLARLRERTGSPRTRFGRELRGVYLDVRRLATQFRDHGTHVPYPGLGTELRRLAEHADAQAALLATELRAIAGNPDPSDPIEPRAGRNHWERMTIDLADLEALQRHATELAFRWDLDFPASAATLARLAHVTGAMASTVRTMVARSDPHAA
jgi:hypothetical protein